MREDYNNAVMTIELDDSQTVYSIDYLSVYCYAVGVDFGHMEISLNPSAVAVPAKLPEVRSTPPKLVRDTRRC